MRKIINKKLITSFIFIFVFSIFSILTLFPKIINATGEYFYTKEELSGIRTEWGNENTGSGFSTKEECDTYVKKINSSWKPSVCYLGNNATITNVSPASGNIGDLITITGTDLNNVTGVYFNGRDASYSDTKMTSQIKVSIPSGATSGSITVKTKYRGTATYKSFTVSKQDDLYWWYLNTSKEYYGASGRLSVPGFTTEDECNKARLAYEASSSQAKTTGACFQDTQTNILKDRQDLYDVDSASSSSLNDTTYNLLAPLPGLDKVDSSTGISDYFNIMVRIAIGICGVLAVIMIVIGGIQYMGDESIFGKTQAKSQITKAIFGLLIAVGAYALLNTINPDLLGGNGLTIKQVNGEIENTPWETYEKGDNLTSCPSGFIDINVKYGDGTTGDPATINVCRDISNKLVLMINAAYRNAGIKLSGYGSRSIKTQENLRAQNCGGTANIYKASAKCSPATAIPGRSNHEKGLAVDFRCNGQRMNSTSSACYLWLKENAGTYGFKNNYSILKEAWHWSTTGN